MPVNLPPPDPASLHPVRGVRLGVAMAGIRKPNRKDLLVIALAEGAHAAGVFTQNRFCAAPVQVCKEQFASGAAVRALVVNTGVANAGTGPDGLRNARETCAAVARALGCQPGQVLPYSTGVIMEPLPVERIAAGLPQCVADLREDNWASGAEAIMTTDTVPKAGSARVQLGDLGVTLSGIAKGAGMIRPDMATMLGFVATDARVSREALQGLARDAAQSSFNRITVDGDTSTNDSYTVLATGAAGGPLIDGPDHPHYGPLRDGLRELSVRLAQAIVRDGEGATKFITVRVEAGASLAECDSVAYAIAHSPLVKTAFFASDPNLGRILAAIGNAGIADLDISRVDLYLDELPVARAGGRAAGYRDEDGRRVMQKAEIAVRVVLGRGSVQSTVWTCDLSHDYVSINADYRS